ncbi:Fic family protein [Candidatus Woesearchaeota archaeon]|nr:Fic family protein [Candidatus Woesearchaeota archaeon]
MVFISKKIILGKARYYLEKSIRLPNGKIKKFSIYLSNYIPNRPYENIKNCNGLLESKIIYELTKIASKYYKKNHIFDEKLIKKLEDTKIGYKSIINKLSKKQLQDVIDRFTVNFTYESNAIEGNSLTLKDVTMVLHEKKAIKGKDLREIYETFNTREVIELVFNNKLKINEKDIIKMHQILVKNTGVSFGYKTIPNFLLGRNVQTTPPEKVADEMGKLIDWYNKNKDIHPLERAAIFHGRFEKIHPFEDGNGRVGRIIVNIILLNHYYCPLIIRKTHRLSYFNALESFDNNHKDKLDRFFVERYKETYEKFFVIYLKYLK